MTAVSAREVARWLVSAAMSMRAEPSAGFAVGAGCNTVWAGGTPQSSTALRAGSLPTLPAVITSDARAIDPHALARALHGDATMTAACPLFVELCAGTAALSLRLHAGRNARPPVSRMGAKTGYADVILRVLGLRPGQVHTDGTRYLWCEPDAGVRLLLHAYTDRELAQGAAEIIRSWKDEDPRALWERLRAEGPATCPEGLTAREVARWLTVTGWRIGLDGTRYVGPGTPANPAVTHAGMVARLRHTLPATIHPDARALALPTLPPGTVAYMDGPYENTTSYAHLFPRAEQVEVARRWDAAGATVCISEAEPIPELVADGWHQVEITGERKGQRRTFSKQQREWLTMNRAPSWRPSEQRSLFGGAVTASTGRG
jgi:hypothetical protein